jgi:integrase
MVEARKLTQKFVDRISTTGSEKEVWYPDTEIKGLGVRVRESGTATYEYRYRVPNGPGQRRKNLRSISQNKLDSIRDFLRMEFIPELLMGNDPVQRDRERKADTILVDDMLDEVLQIWAQKNRSEGYVKEQTRLYDRFIKPQLGRIPLRDVNSNELRKMLRSLHKTPVQANRVKSLLSFIFKQALRAQYIMTDPTALLEGNAEHAREESLPHEVAVRIIKEGATHVSPEAYDRLCFLIATGCRPIETGRIQWEHFKAEADGIVYWNKPWRVTKNKSDMKVPLADLAVEVIERRKALGVEQPFKPFELRKAWARLKTKGIIPEEYVIKDMRAGFISSLIANDTDIKTTQTLAGHKDPSVTLKHYARAGKEQLEDAVNKLDFS